MRLAKWPHVAIDGWKKNYLALLFAETFAIMGFSLSMPVIPLFLSDDLNITDPSSLKLWTGAIQSSAAIMLAIFAPIWGHFADTYSKRAMLLRAMFGGAIIVSLMGLVQSPWQLLVLRAVQGCLTGTIAAATVLTTGIVPRLHLALALGFLQTGVAVGNSMGPLAGGIVADLLGRRYAFFGTGVLLIIAGVIVFKFVHDEPKVQYLPNLDAKPKVTVPLLARMKKLLPDFRPILTSSSLISLIIGSFSILIANNTANPIMPLFIKEISKHNPTSYFAVHLGFATGLILGLGAAATAVAAIISGKFAIKIGYWKTLCFCLAAGCVSILPQALSRNAYELCIIHVVASFFIGGAVPIMQALIAENTDRDQQGAVFGWTTSVSMLGAAIGPLIGSAAAMISYHAVFPVTSLILGLSSARLFVSIKKKKTV
jgi:DHA1 family multidrug resistance protein-like MFS transporter